MKTITNIVRADDKGIYFIYDDGTITKTDAERIRPIASGEDRNNIALAARQQASTILYAIAREAEAAKEQARNAAICNAYGVELEAYTDGGHLICPHCGEFVAAGIENEDGVITCPHCSAMFESDDCEEATVYDYFNKNEIYNIEYRIDGNKELNSVSAMIACGGPNIYIDTEQGAILLYWWGEKASYNLHSDTIEAIETYFNEYWEATK